MPGTNPKAEQIYFEGIPDNFVNVVAGDAIRLFPFGKFFKGGKAREFTRELASKFKLPHFKPPIKLGSHEDSTKAGGVIVGLEVREDGLYALTEFTEKGATSFSEGDYKYHSPEVVWEGGVEDSGTGEMIEGPLIIGMALLHTPHLGEAAALYSYEVGDIPEQLTEVQNMTTGETVQVDKKLYEKFLDFFSKEPTPEPENTEPEIKPEEFTAVEKERDDFKSEIETMKAKATKAELFTAIRGEFEADKEKKEKDQFGAAFQGIVKEDENVEMLASMTAEQRKWVTTQLGAFSAQIDESELTGEQGENADPISDDPIVAYNAAITAHQDEHKTDYPTAMNAVNVEKPELVRAYGNATRKN